MKIVCDNCSAKYSIADEKVAGKVFKIRCKKCTNVIVVRGDQLEAPQEEATQVYDYGGEAVWHVVVDGDQQGPFAPAQIGAMLTDGTIDWEAYVWKEGFDGWKPARDIPELVADVTGDAPADDAPAAAAAPVAAAADPMGADPFAAASGGESFDGGAEAARADAPGEDAGADLFAQSDPSSSPFGGVDDDVVASAPSPRVSEEESMTGQRNENSVLFSLSNLQALATGGPGDSPAPSSGGGASAPAGHASGEGSGLIDIRALASATASLGASSGASASSGGNDDLLSIGGGGGLGSSLGAPILAPAAAEPEKGGKGMVLGLAAGGALVVGLLIALVVVLTRTPEPVVAAATAPTAAGQPGANPNAATPAVPSATQMEMPAAGAPVTSAMTDPVAEEGNDDPEPTSMGSGRRPRRNGMSSSPMTSSPTTSPRMTSSMMASGSIDDLLNAALGMGMGMARMEAAMMASSNLPQQPDRGDVGRALRSVSSRVQSCGNGTSGVANAAITFANSGRVRSVRVTGVPPAVQSCVARTVRSARVSPFQRATFNVNFPFRVR